jgi:hypothetical protein
MLCAVETCATSGDREPQFSVTRAADFSKGETVSVFGVFRNGRLSPEAWDDFGAGLSLPFSQETCQAAYTKDLVNTNPEVMSTVDDYAKENGVSDELLNQFAPMARGDTIMVIAMTGQPSRPAADAGAGKASKPAPARSTSGQGNTGGPNGGPVGGRGMGRGGGGGLGRGGFGRRGTRSVSSEQAKPQRDAWEISASFFSIRLHHTVGQVSMTYAGQDLDRALRVFVGRLGAEMPGLPCRGWDWSTQVDEGALRRMLTD